MSEFDDWIGRSITASDTLDPARCNALDIALGGAGRLQIGDPMPLLDHWLHFWDMKPPSELGTDGHPAKGGFLPPVRLPRRMWAGGRLSFAKPLMLGQEVRKTSTIASIAEKEGRSGKLVFVTIRHDFEAGEGVAVSEEQDLVYREPATRRLAMSEPEDAPGAAWCATINPDPVLLFRYSALTMNGHRIHYDRPYAIEEEYYPGLVVHGPLQAKLMIRLAVAHLGDTITEFDFRGQQPAFDGLPLHICGNPGDRDAELWTQQGEAKNMVASVRTDR